MEAAIDFGTTLTKVIVMNKNKVLRKRIFKKPDLLLIRRFLRDDLSRITTIYHTRGDKKVMEKSFIGIKIKQADELKSLSKGAYHISKKKKGLIISLGSGTAMLLNGKHIGGTPMGGGFIQGLCELLIGSDDVYEIGSFARKGSLSKTSTLIRDIYPKGISNLSGQDIASYFSHVRHPNQADIALTIFTIVAETIGLMAGQLVKANKVKNVIITGNLSKQKIVTSIIEKRIKRIAGKTIKFSIPQNAEYAVAIGCTL